MESAAEVVAHAAERHGAERRQDHVARSALAGARVLAQQEEQLARTRELRRVAEAAAARVEGALELPGRRRRAHRAPGTA